MVKAGTMERGIEAALERLRGTLESRTREQEERAWRDYLTLLRENREREERLRRKGKKAKRQPVAAKAPADSWACDYDLLG